jgi:hypothetical protein
MHDCFEDSLFLPRLPHLKRSDAEQFYQSDSNAANWLMKICLNEHIITTSGRRAKVHEQRDDLGAELVNSSSGGDLVKRTKTDFS